MTRDRVGEDDTTAATESFKLAISAAMPNLRAFAISLCRDVSRADDLVQETLLKAWSHRDSFEEGTNLRAWLFTILRNTFFSECRKLSRESQDDQGLAMRLTTREEQQGHVDLADVMAALDRLSAEQREAITLIAAEGFSYKEAARISGCEIGTIKSRVNRGRKRLADLVGVRGPEDYGPEASPADLNGHAFNRR